MRKLLIVLVLIPVAYAQAQIRFENVAEEAGIDDPGINGAGVAFWDYDQDGDVDVYIPKFSGPVIFPKPVVQAEVHGSGI